MPANRRVVTTLAAATLPVGLAVGLAAPAEAGPPLDRQVYSGTYSFTACDLYDVSGTFVSREVVRDSTPPLGGQFFKFTRTYELTETWTNPVTSEYLTLSARGHFVELRPTTTDGRVFDYVAHDTGVFTVHDSSGNLVLREAGLIAFPITFDTLGDSAPGGEVVGEGEPRLAGPHPTFDEDLCVIAEELIG